MASSFSSLIRALRPASRSPQAQRALFRPVRQRIFPFHDKYFRATFTTSPTSIPPQAETSTGSPEPTQPPPPSAKAQNQPTYQLTFTCKPCKERSSHEISKQGYHNGTVLITCPQCKNRHVITDHLKVFSDHAFTIEDLMRDKGELVRRGSITDGGDVELWDDRGTTS